jgi:hypothetical protein
MKSEIIKNSRYLPVLAFLSMVLVITSWIGCKKASVVVEVSRYKYLKEVTASPVKILGGQSSQITATVLTVITYSDGTNAVQGAPGESVSFSIDDISCGGISSVTGTTNSQGKALITFTGSNGTGLAPCICTITADWGGRISGQTAECVVVVTSPGK